MGHTVLIVEDEPDTRDMLVRALSSEGFSVKATDTLYGALHIVSQDKTVPCILLDYNLPGMPMEKFLKELYAIHPGIRIVLMSAVDKLAEKAERIGLPHFITKPLDFEKLRMLLTECVASKKSPPPHK